MAAEIVENGVDSAEQEGGQKEIKVGAYYSPMKYLYPFLFFGSRKFYNFIFRRNKLWLMR